MALRKVATLTIITVAIVVLLLTLATMGVLGIPRGSGSVSAVNVGVYSDLGCITGCTSINWGNIKPGSAVTKTIYVKNSGNTMVTLKMSTSSWNPRAAKSLVTLSWNLDNRLLSVGEVVPATLTLAAASNIGSLTNFNFVIIITGTQQKG